MEFASDAVAWGSGTACLLLVPWAGSPSIPDVDTIGTWGTLPGEYTDRSKASAGTTGSAGGISWGGYTCAGPSGRS